MGIVLIPKPRLTLADVQRVAQGLPVKLSAAGHQRIARARKVVSGIIAAQQPVYGINTGFGALADRTIPVEEITRLQRNLILSHAVGAGELLRPEEVRAIMFLRANMLSKGFSGVRCRLVEQLVNMLNRGVIPCVPEYGSVGASGDLAPLAYIAAVVIGEGAALWNGERLPGSWALKAAGLEPYELQPKEGLALTNGTEAMSGIGALTVLRAERLADWADKSGALTAAALGADPRVFAPALYQLKPHSGVKTVAANLADWLRGSEADKTRVQDAYSLRCMPQVHGAAREGIAFARKTVETEINSVTDNPVIIGLTAIAGGNFHGSVLALALDTLAIAMTQLAGIAERRIFRLLDSKLSGLPAFLIPKPGTNSGLMITQFLAASLVTECKLLAAPASVHSLPTSAGQEDYVSMGMNSALKARKICQHVETILAIELLCAAQAIDLAGRRLPRGLSRLHQKIRALVPFAAQDRFWDQDIGQLRSILK